MKQNYRTINQIKQIVEQEDGTIVKNWGGKLPVALVWPNSYRVGMSSLALHILYRLFNDEPDVACERVFFGYQQAPRRDEPVISLESQRGLDEFGAVAFTVSYEMDYFNIIEILRRSGFPIFAADRDESWPLLIAGGPAVYTNPEPLAEIFDAFAIGEGEAIVPPLVDALWEAADAPRPEAYQRLAQVDGLYIPALNNGPVGRVWIKDVDTQPTVTQIYTDNTEFGDRTLLEIARGCGRGCRFCMAGYVYRPMREMHLNTVLAAAKHGLKHRDRVGLVSAAVSDHSWIDQIAIELRNMGARLTASSMRVDPISEPLIKGLAESGNQTLTIAPEAGSVRMRKVINKPQSDGQILHAVELAAKYNFPQLKMYFMVGQPTEAEQDVEAIADLTLAARDIFSRNIAINATPYVPKPHTAFQWGAMMPVETIESRIKYLQDRLNPNGVTVRSDSPAWAAVEGVLARGDRRLGRVLARMRKVNLREWYKALAAEGLSQEDFLQERPLDAALPWDTVTTGVTKSFFTWDLRRALRDDLTQACPPAGCLKCNACDEEWAFRPNYEAELGPNLGAYGDNFIPLEIN
ncbi:MAG: radical SAM protein [Anaerolineae bacterium]|nr:radical SAM protein [Anaerolineae bacterium]